MLFLWHDHRLIEGWLEARFRAELHREDPALANDRPLERLEVLRVEFPPRLARELVEPNAVHRADHQAPALDHDRRSRALGRDESGAG